MLEDILLIKDHHKSAAIAIYKEAEKKRTGKFIIAISGESGSGKSELTHMLAKTYFNSGVVAKPIHIDNFYKTIPLERTAWRVEHGIEKVVGPGEYDNVAIERVIKAFREGEEVTMPCVDLVTQRVDSLTTNFSETEVLILDGLYAIMIEDVDLRVMIDLTYHETKKSQESRGKERSDETRMRVLEAEHRAVKALRPLAQLFVSKNYMVYQGKSS